MDIAQTRKGRPEFACVGVRNDLLWVICRITGHASVQTLQRYIKADELETVRKIKAAYRYFD